jgi:TfoX/Sxy family transcriptional regulator of competence genes
MPVPGDAITEVSVASDVSFVEYVCEQVGGAGRVTYRKMFGEFAVYCDGKVVALVCDNQFFLKPTSGGRALLGRVKEVPPYEGAKPFFLLDAELEDAEQAAKLVWTTARELPAPSAKPARTKGSSARPESAARARPKPRRT